MKNAKLHQLVAMVIAGSSVGALLLACAGECPQAGTQRLVVPIPSNEGDAGTDADMTPPESIESLCSRYCYRPISCKPATIPQPDGSEIPAFECIEDHNCYAGRRPAGLLGLEIDTGVSAEARWLAVAMHLEAASIEAFRLVRRDLRALGAPRALLRQASRAARDEKRHARRMRALAKRTGIACRAARIASTPALSLEQLALQNAVEGCVRETFGAVVARYQAMHAQNRDLAAVMKTIAIDEAEHAALAFRIDVWARKRLGHAARERIHAARALAARELMRDAATPMDTRARINLGLPDACTRAALARAMLQDLHIVSDELV